MSTSSAREPFLGYLYQSIYSLYILFTKGASNPNLGITIEKFDDIAFEDKGDSLQLIQTKHKVNKKGGLGNTHKDIWQTIYNWIELTRETGENFNSNIYSIITTSKASVGSAAHYLKPDISVRNVTKAVGILKKAKQDSESKTLEHAFKAFDALTEDQIDSFFSNVYIFDREPTINKVKDKVMDEFDFFVHPEHKEEVYDRILGWWTNLLVDRLSDEDSNAILYKRVRAKFQDIRDEYTKDSLPINFPDPLAESEIELTDDQRFFIEQVEQISLGRKRIVKAISDFYRAFQQRSKWLRDADLEIDELISYEKRLKDEWEREFYAINDEVDDSFKDEDLVKNGKTLFNKFDLEKVSDQNLFIRAKVSDPYIIRGSMHMLSNKFEIGWHPLFQKRLLDLYESTYKETQQNK